MRRFAVAVTLLASIVVCPSRVYAQASIIGSVRDDGTGQYRIENLRPGTYVVTFTLGGFVTVLREGIGLAGSFTATVNADLRLGSIEETITVTGESPIVDVQNVTQQRVVDQEGCPSNGKKRSSPGGAVAIRETDISPLVAA